MANCPSCVTCIDLKSFVKAKTDNTDFALMILFVLFFVLLYKDRKHTKCLCIVMSVMDYCPL